MSTRVERLFADVLKILRDDDRDLQRIADYPDSNIALDDFWGTIGDDAVLQPVDRATDRRLSGDETDMAEDERRAVDGAIRVHGIDALAMYKSYRYLQKRPFPNYWGVFYLESGIARLEQLLLYDLPALQDSRFVAFDFLWRHESYHFRFDVASLAFEGVAQKALYEPQKRAFYRCRDQQPEEALANHNVWEWAKREDLSLSPRRGKLSRSGIANFAYDFMKTQPGAYARFDESITDLRREAAAGLFEGLRFRGAAPQRIDLSPWIGLIPTELRGHGNVPEYLVRNVRLSKLLALAHWFPLVRVISESDDVAKKIATRYQNLRQQWVATKDKLVRATGAAGLNFKQWKPSPGLWSVRVNDNFRAHLRAIDTTKGIWEVVEFGPHTELGHG